ncbi:hypothetical protein ABZ853_21690 [Streptomyces albidoflavus]
MTAGRMVWSAVAFVLATPIMSAMFREDGQFTERSVALGIVFGASIAMIAGIAAGRDGS